MKPPDPEKENPAVVGGANESADSHSKVNGRLHLVNGRFCRPISAAALAQEITRRLMLTVETGSDFDARVQRTLADAKRKGATNEHR